MEVEQQEAEEMVGAVETEAMVAADTEAVAKGWAERVGVETDAEGQEEAVTAVEAPVAEAKAEAEEAQGAVARKATSCQQTRSRRRSHSRQQHKRSKTMRRCSRRQRRRRTARHSSPECRSACPDPKAHPNSEQCP